MMLCYLTSSLFLLFTLCAKSAPAPVPGNQQSHCNHERCNDIFVPSVPLNDPFSSDNEDLQQDLEVIKNLAGGIDRSPLSIVRAYPSTMSDLDTMAYASRASSFAGMSEPIIIQSKAVDQQDSVITSSEIEKTAAFKLTELIQSHLNELRPLKEVRIDPDSVQLLEAYPNALILFDKASEKLVFAEFKAIKRGDPVQSGQGSFPRSRSSVEIHRPNNNIENIDDNEPLKQSISSSSFVTSGITEDEKCFEIKIYYRQNGSVIIDNASFSKFFEYLDIDFNDKYAYRSHLTSYLSDFIIQRQVFQTSSPSPSFYL